MNRQAWLIIAFIALGITVVYFFTGADNRGDVSFGFVLGLLFAWALAQIKSKQQI